MRSAVRLGTLLFVIAPFAGCDGGPESVDATVGTTFLMPRGILEKATGLELRVLEGQVACDAETGEVTFPGGEEAAREVAKTELGQDGCPANVRFCGDVSVSKSSKPRVFEATANADSGQLAFGCATATIDQDVVPLTIKMFRFLAPAVCGDGTLQPTEQCEPGGTSVCDDECQSKEILLSVGASGNDTSTGKAGDKTDPFFLWPAGHDVDGRLLALFTDHAVPAGGDSLEIGLRVMSADLTPVTSPAELASGSIFVPPVPTEGQQSRPRAAAIGGKFYVVFEDNTNAAVDVRMRVLTSSLEVDGTDPVGINGGASGEAAPQTAPTISAGRDRLLVAWQDDADGTIVARTVTPGSLALGNQNQVSSGSGNSRPDVAATSKGWAVIWTSETGIKLRSLDESGTPSGGEQSVSTGGAEGGCVASLPDGRFAIAWSNGGDIFVQRFDERGIAIGDAVTVNDVVTDGAQTQPAIAAVSTGSGSYVVAWHDAKSGHVRARYLGGSTGFLFNNVDGKNTEFQASRTSGRERKAPVVAVGGSGPFIAIGWEDQSSSGAGIIARRFPLPTE